GGRDKKGVLYLVTKQQVDQIRCRYSSPDTDPTPVTSTPQSSEKQEEVQDVGLTPPTQIDHSQTIIEEKAPLSPPDEIRGVKRIFHGGRCCGCELSGWNKYGEKIFCDRCAIKEGLKDTLEGKPFYPEGDTKEGRKI